MRYFGYPITRFYSHRFESNSDSVIISLREQVQFSTPNKTYHFLYSLYKNAPAKTKIFNIVAHQSTN